LKKEGGKKPLRGGNDREEKEKLPFRRRGGKGRAEKPSSFIEGGVSNGQSFKERGQA